jgi:glycosyltransferase involved in cell wall biosynthesis
MTKNLLFIPMYKCRPQIIRVLGKLTPDNCKFFEKILLIDNRSFDGTFEAAENLLASHPLKSKISMVINPINVGLGGTHKAAFQFALDNGYDHAVILHGDDQGDLDDFLPILESMNEKQLHSYVFGARFHPRSRLINYSRIRISGNKVFNFISSFLAKKNILDFGGSGLNLFPLRMIGEQDFQKYANDLTFHVYILLNAVRLGQPFRFVPISWKEDDQISNVKLFRQVLKLLSILIKYLLNGKPLTERSYQEVRPDWESSSVQKGEI